MSRRRLPNRRRAETFNAEFDGAGYSVTIGYGPSGTASEIFAHGAKVGSGVDLLLDDCGVALSLLLQFGAAPESLAASVGRAGGKATSVIGMLADLLAEHPTIGADRR